MNSKIVTAIGIGALTMLVAGNVLAQGQYAGQQTRTIKALSDEETRDLLEGRGMGLAKAAELNRYPGPAHLLQLAKKLDLSEADADAARQVFATMDQEAKALGTEIVAAEGELDRAFADEKADSATVEALTAKIGALQGRVRAVHLNAHIAVRPLLKDETIARYDALRGYGGADQGNHGGQRQH